MSEQTPRRALQAAKRFLVFLFIVALGGAALVLFSALHSKTWAVEQHDHELWIVKGRQLPVGYEPFRPADKVLAAAYAPIALMGDSPGELILAPYDDRDALDQALFRTFKSWIEARLDSDDPERLSQAFKLLKRAELLAGVAAEQRDQLKDLQAKVAYVEGRARLEEAELALREAVSSLKLAAETRNRYTREAGELFERTAPLSEQLARALRLSRLVEPQPKWPEAALPAEKLPLAPAEPDAGAGEDAAAAPADLPDASAAP